MSFTLSFQSWASLFKDGGQISVRSFHEPVRMKTAERIYCEGDSECTAPPSGTGGNRVKGSRGVQSEGGGGGGASKRSHLLILSQECFSAKPRAHFTHHSPSTHKSPQSHSIYNIYSMHYYLDLSIFNKWVWVVCIGVCFCVCFSTYQEST